MKDTPVKNQITEEAMKRRERTSNKKVNRKRMLPTQKKDRGKTKAKRQGGGVNNNVNDDLCISPESSSAITQQSEPIYSAYLLHHFSFTIVIIIIQFGLEIHITITNIVTNDTLQTMQITLV